MLTMLIAGHDTSTALLAWTLYLLGRHPKALGRVQAEVDRVCGTELPASTHLSELDYLEQVIKETLRLYPPIHLGTRVAVTELQFQNYRIPAGSRVLYSIYLTHRHQQYWPDPNRFDPERFTREQERRRPPFTFVPFGGGPRICLGFLFAQIEAKAVLARILQKFSLKLVDDGVHPHMGATLEPRPGVMMRVQRR
jgi:cytochrome P450